MNRNKFNRLLIRFFIVFSFQLIIKAFDYSFSRLFEITYRGTVFSVFFISVWILGWYFAEFVNKKIERRLQWVKIIYNVFIGYIIGLISVVGYRFGDVYLFDNSDLWVDIPLYNPEFTVSFLLIYMMIYGFNEFFNANMKAKEERINIERLQKENTLAQYMALKAQIEPHFLFNSLSVLNSIVHKDVNLASEFIIKLSRTLRYIIEKNDFTLVFLKEDIFIAEDYYFLIKTRFEDCIEYKNNISQNLIETTCIPPVTIQILIENAIKHNKQSAEKPLKIILESTEEYIVVKNSLNLRNEISNSTGKGLKNIAKRYELISGKSIVVSVDEEYFYVKLPILKKCDYEHFDN
ncbi:MAG: histidine kinase [Bacteroidales bacterium]|nr:histidine kinase [Bacteroidales bacterium]